jgi:hypothetical protein
MSARAGVGIFEQLRVTNSSMVELLKRLDEWIRPRVVLQVKPSRTSSNVLKFHLKNIGNSPAYGISCHFTPDIKYASTELMLSQIPIFNKMSILVPNEEIVFFFANAIEYLNDKSKPAEFEANISYKNDHGTDFEEKIAIKVNELEGLLFLPEKSLADVAEGLRRIERSLTRIESSLTKEKSQKIRSEAIRLSTLAKNRKQSILKKRRPIIVAKE